MVPLGALLGLAIAHLTFGAVAGLVTGPLAVTLAWLLWLLVLSLVGYVVATWAIRPVLPPDPAPTVIAFVPSSPVEQLARGFCIGVNGYFNYAVLARFVPLPLAVIVPGLVVLCALPVLARNPAYKALVGWLGWVLPSSLVASAIGFTVIFLPSAAMLMTELGPRGWRIDWTTGSLETTGGIASLIPTDGFGIGNFTFLSPDPPFVAATWAAFPTPFYGSPGISSHESGHTLNTALFGGPFLLINWIDENLVEVVIRGRPNGMDAYAETLAEGHDPEPGWKSLRHWS